MERLGNQHRVWAEDNRQFLARAGFGKGATLVDLGCVPGYTTLDLARTVGSEGQVIAVDRDVERSLLLLKERAEATGISNIETEAGRRGRPWLQPGDRKRTPWAAQLHRLAG